MSTDKLSKEASGPAKDAATKEAKASKEKAKEKTEKEAARQDGEERDAETQESHVEESTAKETAASESMEGKASEQSAAEESAQGTVASDPADNHASKAKEATEDEAASVPLEGKTTEASDAKELSEGTAAREFEEGEASGAEKEVGVGAGASREGSERGGQPRSASDGSAGSGEGPGEDKGGEATTKSSAADTLPDEFMPPPSPAHTWLPVSLAAAAWPAAPGAAGVEEWQIEVMAQQIEAYKNAAADLESQAEAMYALGARLEAELEALGGRMDEPFAWPQAVDEPASIRLGRGSPAVKHGGSSCKTAEEGIKTGEEVYSV